MMNPESFPENRHDQLNAYWHLFYKHLVNFDCVEDLKTKIKTATDYPFTFIKDITNIDANAEILKPIGWQLTVIDGQ